MWFVEDADLVLIEGNTIYSDMDTLYKDKYQKFLMVILYKTLQLIFLVLFISCAHVPDVCCHHYQPTIHACSFNVLKFNMY